MRPSISQLTLQSLEQACEQLDLTRMQQDLHQSGRRRIGILGGTFNPPHLGLSLIHI